MKTDWARLRSGFASVVGIVVTPFDANDCLDEEAFVRLVRRVTDAGVRTLTPNGNTSEYYSLSPHERHRAVELTREVAPDAFVVPGVGGDANTAEQDARRYADLGVDAVMVHEPVHPFWSPAGWLGYHQRIARAAPGLGVAPYLRSPKVGAEVLDELVVTCPNVVAVKYAVPDPLAFATTVQAVGSDRVAWVCGLAEAWAPYFAIAGAVGFTSGLVCVDPRRSLRMHEHLQSGEYPAAMAEWREIREFEAMRANDASQMNVTVVKEALAQAGLCDRTVRPPLSLLSDPERRQLETIMSAWTATEPDGRTRQGGAR